MQLGDRSSIREGNDHYYTIMMQKLERTMTSFDRRESERNETREGRGLRIWLMVGREKRRDFKSFKVPQF